MPGAPSRKDMPVIDAEKVTAVVDYLKKGVAEQPAELLKKQDVSYFKIPVEYVIKGNFLGYIKTQMQQQILQLTI